MPKGLRNPAEEIPLGMVGGGGGGVGRFVDSAVPAATLAGFVGAGAKLTDLKAKQAEKRSARKQAEEEALREWAGARESEAVREAEAELKRESRRGMKSGGMTASKRADGCAQRGKTRGRMV